MSNQQKVSTEQEARYRQICQNWAREDPIGPPEEGPQNAARLKAVWAEEEREQYKLYESRGISQANWLQHLDEMTDEEITFFLDREPGKERLDEERRARPSISDRTRAEFMRDF